MNALVKLDSHVPALVSLDDDRQAAHDYQLAEKAPSTRAAYTADARHFSGWCTARGLCPLPADPDTVAAYLASLARAGLAPSSIGRRVSAVQYLHRLGGFASPTQAEAVRITMAGIRRTADFTSRRKSAATHELVRAMLDTCGDDTTGLRDRALLALGFAGAFRRSELVALRLDDLEEVPDGYRVTIRRSKTDQVGEGQQIVIPRGARIRPVEAVQTWLARAGVTDGLLFRRLHRYGAVRQAGITPHMVARVIKGRCQLAGLDPAIFSGHSLRAGFLTSAAEAGASVFKMMEVSRHKSVDVLSGYVRRANLFVDHAGASFL
jgi:site-specific recombinase XerD